MNAIEEAHRLQDLFVLFGIHARSVRAMQQMDDKALFKLFEQVRDKLKANQTHSEIEMIREYFDDVVEVNKMRGVQRALEKIGK